MSKLFIQVSNGFDQLVMKTVSQLANDNGAMLEYLTNREALSAVAEFPEGADLLAFREAVFGQFNRLYGKRPTDPLFAFEVGEKVTYVGLTDTKGLGLEFQFIGVELTGSPAAVENVAKDLTVLMNRNGGSLRGQHSHIRGSLEERRESRQSIYSAPQSMIPALVDGMKGIIDLQSQVKGSVHPIVPSAHPVSLPAKDLRAS